jgi:hypothetical protein
LSSARAGSSGEQVRSRRIGERWDLPDFIMNFTISLGHERFWILLCWFGWRRFGQFDSDEQDFGSFSSRRFRVASKYGSL